jgi:hypothetical protein
VPAADVVWYTSEMSLGAQREAPLMALTSVVIRRAVEEGLFAANSLYWGDALTLTRRTRAGSWSCNCKRAERMATTVYAAPQSSRSRGN